MIIDDTPVSFLTSTTFSPIPAGVMGRLRVFSWKSKRPVCVQTGLFWSVKRKNEDQRAMRLQISLENAAGSSIGIPAMSSAWLYSRDVYCLSWSGFS